MGSSTGENVAVGRGPYAYSTMGTVGPGQALACQTQSQGRRQDN